MPHEAPEHESDDTPTTERFTAVKRSVFIFYSCNKKADACKMQTSAFYISDAFPLTIITSLPFSP